MPTPSLDIEKLQAALDLVKQFGTVSGAAESIGIPRQTLQHRVRLAKEKGLDMPASQSRQAKPKVLVDIGFAIREALRAGPRTIDELSSACNVSAAEILDAGEALIEAGEPIQRRKGGVYALDVSGQLPAYVAGAQIEIVSRPDNTFCFLANGDLHAGSKYCRWDVREDLVRKAEAKGAQAIFDTGNWIDGVASFNRYDLEAVGMSAQCKLLAAKHPKTRLPIYAVTGDDHEGWFAQREGVDIGRYNENIMREAGHDWHDLGYMEAHVRLVNANTGKSQVMSVMHPGGGSAYATSYRPQKIIESFEGGEKPAVVLMGHYHKLEAGNARNVWYCQTGCGQDQSPFMRKKSLEAHVGGAIVTLTQDPNTGAILGMDAGFLRYFNRDYYNPATRWSHHGPVGQPPRRL